MKRFTMAVFVVFVLPFFSTTSFAQAEPAKGSRQDLRYITNQYKQIAADYLPGTPYEKTMNDLVQRVEGMSEDESRYLKPLIPSMLVNLQMFKEALSNLDKPQSAQSRIQAAGAAAEFPNAEYPNIQLSNYGNLALPALYDVTSIIPTAVNFFTNGEAVANEWTSSWVNAVPLTCITRFDSDGNPIRTPDISMQTLRTAVQVAEALKEGANCVLEQVLEGVGFGGNLKWLTILPTGLWLVEKAIYENMKECDTMISGAEATASYQRLGHIHDNLGSISAAINASQGDLSLVKNQLTTHDTDIKALLSSIQAKQAEIIKLLLTPEGKRPGWGKLGY